MKGNRIPDHDHIARYCRPTSIEDGQIQATAFMIRANEESLSVNWMEFLGRSNRAEEIAEIRRIYSSKFSRVGVNAKIAILNVGYVRKKVLQESIDRRRLDVRHDPIISDGINDPSHSGIYNLRQDDELIAELIVETIQETYQARI